MLVVVVVRARARLPSVPVTRGRDWGRACRFPDADFVVVAGGREDGWVRGVPCYAVDAANVCVEGLD